MITVRSVSGKTYTLVEDTAGTTAFIAAIENPKYAGIARDGRKNVLAKEAARYEKMDLPSNLWERLPVHYIPKSKLSASSLVREIKRTPNDHNIEKVSIAGTTLFADTIGGSTTYYYVVHEK